jgi:hypothetical protein
MRVQLDGRSATLHMRVSTTFATTHPRYAFKYTHTWIAWRQARLHSVSERRGVTNQRVLGRWGSLALAPAATTTLADAGARRSGTAVAYTHF